MQPDKLQIPLYTLLFTGLALFSHYLLINWMAFTEPVIDRLTTVWAYGFIITAFNIVGFTLIRLSEWINQTTLLFSEKRRKVMITYSLVALILWGLNYGLLVAAKTLAGASQPFLFPNGGIRILILVWLVELVIVGLLIVNRSIVQTLALHDEAARLREESNQARYIALQNQLNPHFLFNSLNTLIAEIQYNPKNAVRFTRELSDVYRYVLQGQQQNLVSLEDELTFLRSYIYLHQVRLGDCIQIENRLPEEADEMLLPPLTLQILAENVIKHNSINADKPMVITLELEENRTLLAVRNDLAPKITQNPLGTGLQNLSIRYKLLTGKNIEIDENRTKQTFTVKVPVIYD